MSGAFRLAAGIALIVWGLLPLAHIVQGVARPESYSVAAWVIGGLLLLGALLYPSAMPRRTEASRPREAPPPAAPAPSPAAATRSAPLQTHGAQPSAAAAASAAPAAAAMAAPAGVVALATSRCAGFSIAKEGDTPEQNEDAFAFDAERGCFAVADGVSSSHFARQWARLLVEEFVRADDLPGEFRSLQPWIAERAATWDAGIDWAAVKARVTWAYDEVKGTGAAATLLGLRLEPLAGATTPLARWHALAIGDCGLFHIRGKDLIGAFPLQRPDDFDNTPSMVSSRKDLNEQFALLQRSEGTCRAGDAFLLATDALAHWLLAWRARGQAPWLELLGLQGEREFAELVARLRRERLMRNDDTTLVVIEVQQGRR
jgi:serine/threonine protein phosphatase PrpC